MLSLFKFRTNEILYKIRERSFTGLIILFQKHKIFINQIIKHDRIPSQGIRRQNMQLSHF